MIDLFRKQLYNWHMPISKEWKYAQTKEMSQGLSIAHS